jgi:HAMP domain-containing protein
MQKYVRWRLRWEFFAITILAGSAPLAFYAWYPLNYFNNSLQEIQNDVLKTEFRDAEALYRVTLRRLEEDTRRLSNRIEYSVQKDTEASTKSLFMPQGVDFAYLVDRGIAEFLVDPVSLKPPNKGLRERLDRLAEDLDCHESVSGLVNLGSDSYLVSIRNVRSAMDSGAMGCGHLILGIDVKKNLVPNLSEMTQNTISIAVVGEQERIGDAATIRVIKRDPSILTAQKEIRGISGATDFLLQIDLNTGLFSRLQSQQFWFFVLFAVALYLAAFLGTAWAATWILKPINRLVRVMGKIKGPDTYSGRLPEDRADEIGRLAAGFNRLMARLEAAQMEIEAAEAQKIEAERLETIHAMVVTLAHEINNPLTYILGEADLMLMDDELSDEDRRRAELIRDMSLRISGVIQKLQDLQKAELVTYLDWQKMLRIGDDDPGNPSLATTSARLVNT